MKSIAELNKERETKFSEMFKKVGLFFAFSDKQFEENKTPLREGEKYVSISGGGFLPKGNVEEFSNEMEKIDLWYRGEINKNKAEKKEIIYELYNHECFYSHDYSIVVELFEGVYTEEKIREIYLKEFKRAAKNF